MARLGCCDGSKTPVISQHKGVHGMTFARLLASLQRMNCGFSRVLYMYIARLFAARVSILALPLLVSSCIGQEPAKAPATPETSVNATLPVNWIYGAYLPKDVPIVPLTGEERFKLYLRQTYTTPGIYVKTGFFAIHDQIKETEPDWGDGASGFAKRVGSLQAGNIIQNSLAALGNAVVGFEPRYDRCRCEGGWPRIRHAVVRNFITYGGADDKGIRPQIMSYAAAFGAGVTVASWEPNYPSVLTKGYQSVVTQAWVGVVVDALAEFAPDVKRMLHKKKADDK
jgi:hypothetical protein